MKFQVLYCNEKIDVVEAKDEASAIEKIRDKINFSAYDYDKEEERKKKNWETYHECPGCNYTCFVVEKDEEKYKPLTDKEHELFKAGKLIPQPITVHIKYWKCSRCQRKWKENGKEIRRKTHEM